MKEELWLIWKEPVTRSRYKIGVLTFDNNMYTFKYLALELKEALKNGFSYFPGFEDNSKIYESDRLFANIETRLPNPTREDYLEILNLYDLEKNSSKMEILKATKGRLLTDNYEFVPVFDANKIEFDVAGTRHCPDVKKCKNILNINDKLLLEMAPENEYDAQAIKVIFRKEGKKYHLGYVPRYYSKELTKLLEKKMEYSAMIKNLNFESKISDEDITAEVKIIFNN